MDTSSKLRFSRKSSLQAMHLPDLGHAATPVLKKKATIGDLAPNTPFQKRMASSTDLNKLRLPRLESNDAARAENMPSDIKREKKLPPKLEIVDPNYQYSRESPRKRAARLVRKISLDKMPQRTLESELLHARRIIDRIIQRKRLGLMPQDNPVAPELVRIRCTEAKTGTLKADSTRSGDSYWDQIMISEISVVETEPAEVDELKPLLV